MKLSITTLSEMTSSIMTISIIILLIMTLSTMTSNIMSLMTEGLMILSIRDKLSQSFTVMLYIIYCYAECPYTGLHCAESCGTTAMTNDVIYLAPVA
jgi:hypothetical protein